MTLAAAPPCRIRVPFNAPSSEIAVVLATATGESDFAPVRFDAEHSEPIESGQTQAHRFQAVAVSGGAVALDPGDTFLAIPWGYDSSCRRLPFDQDVWVPEGATAVFWLGNPRTHDGEALLDVRAWHMPYPYGVFAYLNAPRNRRDEDEWLGAEDLYQLLTTLPMPIAGESPTEWRGRIQVFFRDSPDRWSDRFPGPVVKATALRRVAGPAF